MSDMEREYLRQLWTRCREFVEEQAAGEWDDKTINSDADKLMAFVHSEIQRVAKP